MKAKLFLTMVAGIAMAACNQAPQQTSGLHLEYMDQTIKLASPLSTCCQSVLLRH